MQEGISGQVVRESGNQMPMKGAAQQPAKGLSTTVYIYELTNLNQVSRVDASAFYTAIHTKPVGTVHSDSTGVFKIRLAPGAYSLFIKVGGRFYANSFDSNNNISPVTVEKGKRSRIKITENSSATY